MRWLLACGIVLAALGCDKNARPLPPPRDEATRRADQRERIAADFQQIASYYKSYCAETKEPTSSGFWQYLDKQPEARPITGYIREQQYAIQVPPGGVGVIAYEKDPDLNQTFVVAMADGTVNKEMPIAQLEAAVIRPLYLKR